MTVTSKGYFQKILKLKYILSILGIDLGYTFKYTPQPLGTPSGAGLYLPVVPSSRPNMAAVLKAAK